MSFAEAQRELKEAARPALGFDSALLATDRVLSEAEAQHQICQHNDCQVDDCPEQLPFESETAESPMGASDRWGRGG